MSEAGLILRSEVCARIRAHWLATLSPEQLLETHDWTVDVDGSGRI